MYVHLGLQCRRPWFNSWVKKFPWRRDRLPTPVFMGFPGGSDSKESACIVGDLGLLPGLGRSPGEGNGYPLQYSCLENPHGQRSLMSHSPWGHKGSDMTERLSTCTSLRLSVCLSVVIFEIQAYCACGINLHCQQAHCNFTPSSLFVLWRNIFGTQRFKIAALSSLGT